MKTNAARSTRTLPVLFVASSLIALCSHAQTADARKNPTSKLYVANVEGLASINTGEKIEDLTKRSVHTAEGVVVETKPDSRNSIVLSNGTGLSFDPDTRLEVQRFQQEPFSPNRTDLETEPSISQTKVFIPRGGIGICASKLVAGSSMVYSTRHADIAIRARKVVIETNDNQTVVSLLEGEVTVGGSRGGGQSLKPGQQAIITRRSSVGPPQIRVQPIPEDNLEAIGDKASMACMARRTVYFDTAERKERNANAEDVFVQNAVEQADDLVAVEVLPGTIPGPSTVSPFEIRQTVIR
jgi:FecR protein